MYANAGKTKNTLSSGSSIMAANNTDRSSGSCDNVDHLSNSIKSSKASSDRCVKIIKKTDGIEKSVANGSSIITFNPVGGTDANFKGGKECCGNCNIF